MTREEVQQLLDSLYTKVDYDEMFKRAEKNQEIFNLLWDMIKDMPPKDSWRLMWILDHATEKRNLFLFPILDEIYVELMKTDNESFIRHAMKLIMRCPISEDYAGELLDRCVKWMHNPKAKISSQVLGLEYFYQVTKMYPEMAPELIAHIDDILENQTSAGYNNRLLKIRREFE